VVESCHRRVVYAREQAAPHGPGRKTAAKSLAPLSLKIRGDLPYPEKPAARADYGVQQQ
jgi:hypothetical protein